MLVEMSVRLRTPLSLIRFSAPSAGPPSPVGAPAIGSSARLNGQAARRTLTVVCPLRDRHRVPTCYLGDHEWQSAPQGNPSTSAPQKEATQAARAARGDAGDRARRDRSETAEDI